MATEDDHSSRPDVAAMLKDQTRACKAARDAITAGAKVEVWDREVPHWMVHGIATTRLRGALRRGTTVLGLDETVEILARHRGEHLRTGIIDAADRSWFFTLYFDATGTELLACSGVNRKPPSREEEEADQVPRNR